MRGGEARVPEGGDRDSEKPSLGNPAKLVSISALPLHSCMTSSELSVRTSVYTSAE